MTYAPIVLFVYNRLDHTKKTVEALQNNYLAAESELFIFADGAKDESAVGQVAAVRDYLKTISGFKSVSITESNENKGLAKSIVGGVTEVVNKYGTVIVLEDDIVTSPYFLQYMNDALSFYAAEDRVMHISGYFYPHQKKLSETFFYNQALCWGWGTWQRAWQHLNMDVDAGIQTLSQLHVRKKMYNRVALSTLKANKAGLAHTWAAFWHASITARQGLCLTPGTSLVNNIGHDNTGVHSKESDLFDVHVAQERLTIASIPFEENNKAVHIATAVIRRSLPSLWYRVGNKIKQRILRKK